MTARHRHSRLRGAMVRYRAARKALHTPASARSRHGLDWMNFFIADVQTGFGTFVAFYLAQQGWSQDRIGVALAAGGIAGVVSQIPGGALADALVWKRGLAALGILMIGAAALILALEPTFVAVLIAELLHGTTAGIITPAIGAISLGLVGRRAMSLRTGHNYRYAAAGHAFTAVLMGLAGDYFARGGIFIAAAALCIPALGALAVIRGDEIDYARARNAATGEHAGKIVRVIDLMKNRGLLLFTAAIVLFQLADASLLPLIGENVAATTTQQATLWMSGLIIVPQIVVAAFAPWVGYHSERKGRRPLLLIGFALEPVRAILLVVTSGYGFLIAGQILNGFTGAIIGVLTVIVVADLTAGTGRFNLAQGTVGALSGLAAAVSTIGSGYMVAAFGFAAGFVAITVVSLAATAVLWVFISETKPERYEE
jgi:predicted MFS family arabinose efflux permease